MTSAPDATISIDVTKDLDSSSALKTLLSSQQGAVFTLLGELEKYALEPIKQAAAAKANAKLALNDPASWKTTNGIAFSLTPAASCSISVDVASETFPVAMSIESTQTKSVAAGPSPGKAYVNIDLDFSIQGSVTDSGTFVGLGVAGKASGSKTATLTFCQQVDDSVPTLTALKMALSQVVFPLDPTCIKDMQVGTIAKVSFDGAFDCEADVTYGLGDHKVSAPSLAKVQQSLESVVQIKPPSEDLNVGAKGSVTYTHTDHFALIIEKTDASKAVLYLVRSAESDWGASVGITLGVTATDATVSIDQTALQTVVGKVTNSSTLAGQVASAVSQPLNNLETSLSGKLKSVIADATGQTGLTVSLGRQKGHTALFTFDVNLALSDQVAKSWSALAGGSVIEALAFKGFTLQAGSGVSDSLKRSSTIQFQFFNLFSFKSVTDYFSTAYTDFGPDGTIRVFRDVGQEQQNDTKRALADFRIHFVATATEDARSNVSQENVDLYIELSESGRSKDGATLAQAVGLISADASVHAAQTAMTTYLAIHPKGKLNLIAIVKRSAYQKLSCTAYEDNKPLPLPHAQDQDNWTAFQDATGTLMPDLAFIRKLDFALWIDFNRACIDKVDSTIVPDRRHNGDLSNVPQELFARVGAPGAQVNYWMLASMGFMNLCEDLTNLAATTPTVDDADQWKNVLNFLTDIVTKDVYAEYAKPIAGALLSQCAIGGAEVTAVADLPTDSSSLTCTLTLA